MQYLFYCKNAVMLKRLKGLQRSNRRRESSLTEPLLSTRHSEEPQSPHVPFASVVTHRAPPPTPPPPPMALPLRTGSQQDRAFRELAARKHRDNIKQEQDRAVRALAARKHRDNSPLLYRLQGRPSSLSAMTAEVKKDAQDRSEFMSRHPELQMTTTKHRAKESLVRVAKADAAGVKAGLDERVGRLLETERLTNRAEWADKMEPVLAPDNRRAHRRTRGRHGSSRGGDRRQVGHGALQQDKSGHFHISISFQ